MKLSVRSRTRGEALALASDLADGALVCMLVSVACLMLGPVLALARQLLVSTVLYLMFMSFAVSALMLNVFSRKALKKANTIVDADASVISSIEALEALEKDLEIHLSSLGPGDVSPDCNCPVCVDATTNERRALSERVAERRDRSQVVLATVSSGTCTCPSGQELYEIFNRNNHSSARVRSGIAICPACHRRWSVSSSTEDGC